jgi:glycerol kinase
MASRTMLFDLAGGAWATSMLSLFGIPEAMLPAVVPTAGAIAVTDAAVCGGLASIGASAGDQQASLYGHGCVRAGQAKLTLGTGAFLWCNAGFRPPAAAPDGVVATAAWRIGERTSYALEGFVPNAGAVTSWLRRIGALGPQEWPAIRPGALAGAGPWCVPALFGLGTPSWAPAATAEIGGLRPDSTGADIAEAAMVGVAHQIADAVDAVGAGLAEPPGLLRADGGVAGNDSVLQAIADLSGIRLERAADGEVTARGAAALAGLGTGHWDEAALAGMTVRTGRAFRPGLPDADRGAARKAWQERLAAVLPSAAAGPAL